MSFRAGKCSHIISLKKFFFIFFSFLSLGSLWWHVINSIFSSISSYGRKSNLGAISIQNIGFILKMKTNKTNPYWKKQQPQAVFGTPGHRAAAGMAPPRCMSFHQLPCPWPCPLPLGTLPSGRRECSGFSALAPLARHSNPC